MARWRGSPVSRERHAPECRLRNARGTHSSSNTRIGDQMCLGLLQCGDGKFSRHARKIIQELFERMAAFDVVDQRLHGNACQRIQACRPEYRGQSGRRRLPSWAFASRRIRLRLVSSTPRLLRGRDKDISWYTEARAQPLYHRHAQFLLARQHLADPARRSQNRDHVRPRQSVLIHEVPDHLRSAQRIGGATCPAHRQR